LHLALCGELRSLRFWVCSEAGKRPEERNTLQYTEFLRRVEQQIDATQAATETQRAAENAITAVFQTLSECLSGGEAKDLAAQLPEELRPPLQHSAEDAERFSLEEFYRRVAEREGADSDTARKDASAVMQVLGMAVTHGELDKVMAQLPAEFNILFRDA
jgi:uncharacterized protein (DUF2267 family)